MILDRQFVTHYSTKYDESELSTSEVDLFSRIGPAVRASGRFNKDQFVQTCDWKSTRTRKLVNSNSPERVEEVTGLALRSSDDIRVPILSILSGVATPTASALLTVWQPDRFTIIDVRALSALKKLTHAALSGVRTVRLKNSYMAYLDLMREISQSLSCSLRELDKALWLFDKESSQ